MQTPILAIGYDLDDIKLPPIILAELNHTNIDPPYYFSITSQHGKIIYCDNINFTSDDNIVMIPNNKMKELFIDGCDIVVVTHVVEIPTNFKPIKIKNKFRKRIISKVITENEGVELVSNLEKPVIISDESVSNPDEPVSNPDEPVSNPDEPVISSKEPVISSDEPVSNPDEPVIISKEKLRELRIKAFCKD